MELRSPAYRSLPPQVEGKIHGNLKVVISKVIWLKEDPGDVYVAFSWWGETDSAQLRISGNKSQCLSVNIKQIYAIKTNENLFKNYINNCKLECIFISERNNKIIGSALLDDLEHIFLDKPYIRLVSVNSVCVPNASGPNSRRTKVGEIIIEIDTQFHHNTTPKKSLKHIQTLDRKEEDEEPRLNKEFHKRENYYYSPEKLKLTQPVCDLRLKKFNNDVADRCVAEIVDRAQKLRKAIMKNSQEECVVLRDSNFDRSVLDQDYENIVNRYKKGNYLKTLSSITSSGLTNFEPESINGYNNFESDHEPLCKHHFNAVSCQTVSQDDEYYDKNEVLLAPEKGSLVDFIATLKINIQSLTLTAAGYRRVCSASITRNEGSLSKVTFIVQYNPNSVNQSLRKTVKIISQRQCGEIIPFDHQAVYNLSKCWIDNEAPFVFKVYQRHFNQQTPTELGSGFVYIKDIVKTKNLSMIQKVAIINKEIKVGELKVSLQLGCDDINFGKNFVDAASISKENVPVHDGELPLHRKCNENVRKVTGNDCDAKSNSQSSAIQNQPVNLESFGNNSNSFHNYHNKSTDNQIQVDIPDISYKEKVVLYGMIYISEGKNLPLCNSYLISQGFHREDRAASHLCINTENPIYSFHQIVPLEHGPDLLERVRDNFIIVEAHSLNSEGSDHFIGLAKLPLHQFYTAYKDPSILTHLLRSEHPVISIDGWVHIINPVTGNSYGIIRALVALGTANQISCLENLRGISRNLNSAECDIRTQLHLCQNSEKSVSPIHSSLRSQECQTDSTLLVEVPYHDVEKSCDSEKSETGQYPPVNSFILEERITKTDHGTQTMNTPFHAMLSNNNLSTSSNNSNPSDRFPIPEVHRSVGVGAEFDDPVDRTLNVNQIDFNSSNSTSQSSLHNHMPTQDNTDGICNQNQTKTNFKSIFKASIDIECAYHLPLIEKVNESIEPSTYVTFPSFSDDGQDENSFNVTNICMFNCNPRWEWRCNANLPIEFITNSQKKLVLRIWRLHDTSRNVQIDVEKDLVVGFATIDLSVLGTGFPIVSGWYHILDFTGQCHGQIKVKITPLENISTFVKSSSTISMNDIFEKSGSDSLKMNLAKSLQNIINNPMPEINNTEENSTDSNDLSVSFLSQSLRQKLTELNEITNRLQSRLNEVVDPTLEDEFEYDIDHQPIDGCDSDENSQNIQYTSTTLQQKCQNLKESGVNSYTNNPSTSSNITNFSDALQKISNFEKKSNVINSCDANENMQHHLVNNSSSHQQTECAVLKGTKVHIDYLLDKLNVPINTIPSGSNLTVQQNVFDILSSLKSTNFHSEERPNTSSTQMIRPTGSQFSLPRSNATNRDEICTPALTEASSNKTYNLLRQSEKGQECPVQLNVNSERTNKVSDLIREELVSENNSASEFDNITSFLISSNVKYLNMNDSVGPLLYHKVLPDVASATTNSIFGRNVQNVDSSDNQDVLDLDNKYTEHFDIVINKGLDKIQNQADNNLLIHLQNSEDQKNVQRDESDFDGGSVYSSKFSIPAGNTNRNMDQMTDFTSSDLIELGDNTETMSITQQEKSSKYNESVTYSSLDMPLSEVSVTSASRQAPDGGNTIEEPVTFVTVDQQQNEN